MSAIGHMVAVTIDPKPIRKYGKSRAEQVAKRAKHPHDPNSAPNIHGPMIAKMLEDGMTTRQAASVLGITYGQAEHRYRTWDALQDRAHLKLMKEIRAKGKKICLHDLHLAIQRLVDAYDANDLELLARSVSRMKGILHARSA